MVRVPTYQQQQIRQAGIPDARITATPSPDAFGASAARAIGSGIAQVALTEQEHADQVFLMKQANQIGQLNLQYKTRIRAAKGEDAFGLPEQVQSDWQKDMGDIQSQARTPNQRQAVNRLVDSNWLDIDGDMQAHIAGERERYDGEQTDAFTKTQEEKAIAHATAPMAPGESLDGYANRTANGIGFSADSSAAAIQLYGLRNGKPREWIEQKSAENRSKVYSGAIAAQLSQGNDLAAKSLYDRFGDSLIGSDKVSVLKSLDVASTRGQSQRIADQIQAKVMKEPAITLQDAVEEAKKLAGDDAILRDATVDRVRNDWALRLQSKELREKQMNDYADEQFETRVSDIDPGVWSLLPASQKKAYQSLEHQIAKNSRPPDNGDPFYALKLRAATDPKGFASDDMRQYRASVSDHDYDELIKMQADVLKGDDRLTRGLSTNADVTKRLMAQLKIPFYSDKNKDPRAIDFFRQLDQAVVANQQATGKEASPEQVEAIGKKLLSDIVISTPRSKWNPQSWFAGDDEETYPLFEAPVPGTEREKIIDALKSQGVSSPTDDQVRDTWNLSRGRYRAQ